MTLTETVDRLLDGAVDLHSHPYPSPFPRRIDVLEAARHYRNSGFRAVVVKSHHHSTAMDVGLLRRHGLEDGGIQVVGAVVMNNHIGGLNKHAVNLSLAMGGRVVWFPTVSSPQHIEHSKHSDLKFPKLAVPLIPDEPVDVWNRDQLKPVVHEILRMIAEADAVLGAGHMDAHSILAILQAARDAGVKRIVVNHPNFVIDASKEEAVKMADLGAVIEHSLCMYDEESTFFQDWSIEVLLDWIRRIGPERSCLGSDLGQENNPLPADSYKKILGRLLDAGLHEREARMLVSDNPARILGLD